MLRAYGNPDEFESKNSSRMRDRQNEKHMNYKNYWYPSVPTNPQQTHIVVAPNRLAAILWQQQQLSYGSSYAMAAVMPWQQAVMIWQQQLWYGSSSFTMASKTWQQQLCCGSSYAKLGNHCVTTTVWQDYLGLNYRNITHGQLIIILHPWCRKKTTQLTLFADTYYKHIRMLGCHSYFKPISKTALAVCINCIVQKWQLINKTTLHCYN